MPRTPFFAPSKRSGAGAAGTGAAPERAAGPGPGPSEQGRKPPQQRRASASASAEGPAGPRRSNVTTFAMLAFLHHFGAGIVHFELSCSKCPRGHHSGDVRTSCPSMDFLYPVCLQAWSAFLTLNRGLCVQ